MKRKAEGKAYIEIFVSLFSGIVAFERNYAAYSEKALRRLLPLMRQGVYWDADSIDPATRIRIEHLLTDEDDETISSRTREVIGRKNFMKLIDFSGLPPHLATYVVYDRHAEAASISRWQTPADINRFLASFRQHSLRNPIVEQVVCETLRVVRDVWKAVGHIDKIHLELAREMKLPAAKREEICRKQRENEIARLRAKALLAAFVNPEYEVEGVRPYSPSQQELFRIYEDGAIHNGTSVDEDIKNILSRFDDMRSEALAPADVKRYMLWLSQRYSSPYTGQNIPLSRLFTTDYEVEHIIPRARYYDDSFSNKVVCESAVNKLKNTQLAHEFIAEKGGCSVPLRDGKVVNLLSLEEYEKHVNVCFSSQPAKRRKLMIDEIPEKFIERQLNDTRYIGRYVMSLLSNIVREEDEVDANSKNLILCTGAVTDRLKQDWGVSNLWNSLIFPRFVRLNELSSSSNYTVRTANGHMIPAMPLSQQQGFSKTYRPPPPCHGCHCDSLCISQYCKLSQQCQCH